MQEIAYVNIALKELVNFWFKQDNSNMWFNATPQDDEYLKQRFHKLFLHTPCINVCKDITQPDILLGKILIFDQLPRHFYRTLNNEITTDFIKRMCERLCESIKLILTLYPNYLTDNYSCNIYKQNFFILPLRHSYKYENVKYCYNILISKNNSLLLFSNKNFYYHTLKKLTTFKKPVRCFPNEGYSTLYNIDHAIYNLVVDTQEHGIFNRLKKLFCFSFSYNFDETALLKTNVYRIVRNAVYSLSKEVETLNLILSFSGGVDSSLLLACLITLKKTVPNLIDSLQAIHINYNNNKKFFCHSTLEREFCVRFCYANGVPIFVRDITETHRKTEFDRGIYEDVTKEIRFDSYKFLIDQFERRENKQGFVCLGHNKDDCFENLISNIKISKNFNNLFGMEELSVNKVVNIFRPLLTVSKEEILSTALKCGVVHTQNSTPRECERGKIREHFKNQQDFLQGLEKIKEIVSQSFNVIEKIYKEEIEPFILYSSDESTIKGSSEQRSDRKYIVSRLYPKELFLKEVYSHFFRKNSHLFTKPSKYSIENLVKEIRNGKNKRVNLTKSVYCDLIFEEEKMVIYY